MLISRYRTQSLNILTNSLGSRLKTQSSLTVAEQSFFGEILVLEISISFVNKKILVAHRDFRRRQILNMFKNLAATDSRINVGN